MIELDDTNKRILEMLQKNARIALKKIAQELGVSETTVFLRVRKLQEKGIIKRFTTVISPEMVGKHLTAFILIKAEPKKHSAILAALKKIDSIYEIYDVTGNYYSITKIRTESREELARILDKIGSIEGITSTETAIVLRNVKEEMAIKV